MHDSKDQQSGTGSEPDTKLCHFGNMHEVDDCLTIWFSSRKLHPEILNNNLCKNIYINIKSTSEASKF